MNDEQSLTVTRFRSPAELTQWNTVLDAYLQTMDSQETQRAYRRVISEAMQELGELDQLTALSLTHYREECMRRLSEDAAAPLSSSSVSQRLAALRSFLKFAVMTGQTGLTYDVIRFTLKSPKVRVVRAYLILSDKEMGHLLAAARHKPRDRVLLTVAGATGLRAAELCNLKLGDLTTDAEGDLIIRVRHGKGGKDRLVPLDRGTAALVRAYVATRDLTIGGKTSASEYLFRSRQGDGRLRTARLRQLIDEYLRKAKIEKPISMHSLRHGAAIKWLRNDAPVPVVQRLLGHESLDTTSRYLDHLGLDDLKQAVNTVVH